jgi:hypothetical protein
MTLPDMAGNGSTVTDLGQTAICLTIALLICLAWVSITK